MQWDYYWNEPKPIHRQSFIQIWNERLQTKINSMWPWSRERVWICKLMRIRWPKVIPGNCWELDLRNDRYETWFVLCCDQTFTEHCQTHWECLQFKKSESPLKLTGFCDSDWGESVRDRRSITGYNFQLSEKGPLISWKSCEQPTVALCTSEVEYILLTKVVIVSKRNWTSRTCHNELSLNELEIILKL